MHHAASLFGLSLALVVSLVPQTRGHSWVERLMRIGADDFYIGQPGYPRGNGQLVIPPSR